MDLNNEAFVRQLQQDMAALLELDSVHDIADADVTGPDSTVLEDADEDATDSWTTDNSDSEDQDEGKNAKKDDPKPKGESGIKALLLQDATEVPSVIKILQTFDKDKPLSLGLPALLEEIASNCDSQELALLNALCFHFSTKPQSIRFRKTYGNNRTMNDLPPEILGKIASQCDKTSLQTFRLVCSNYAKIGSSFLCKPTLSIYSTPDGLEKLRAVAKNTDVARSVTIFDYYSAEWSHLDTRREWERSVNIQRARSCSPTGLALPDKTEMDYMFDNFMMLQDEQDEWPSTNYDVETFKIAFDKFKNIRKVNLYGGRQMSQIPEQYAELLEEIGAAPKQIDDVTRTMVMILRAAYAKGAVIHELSVGRIGIGFLAALDTMSALEGNNWLLSIGRAIQHLKVLDLQVDLVEDTWWQDNCDLIDNDEEDEMGQSMVMAAGLKGLLGDFLHKAHKLEKLFIDFGPSMMALVTVPKIIDKVFGVEPWSQLTHLSIKKPHCDGSDLLELISRHSKTLKSVQLIAASLTSNSWQSFFTGLRKHIAGGTSELTSLEFHGLFQWTDPVSTIWSGKRMCGFDEDTGHSDSLGDLMAKYCLHGGKNPWKAAPTENLDVGITMGEMGGLAGLAGLF